MLHCYLQFINEGQNIGLAQGNVASHIVSELALSYIDHLLSNKINSYAIRDFKILRYRDDYRIFTNSFSEAEIILKELASILNTFRMSLNKSKTNHSNDVISSSIKSDKLYWLNRKLKGLTPTNQLLQIKTLAKKFPNSGSLVRALTDFFAENDLSKVNRIAAKSLLSLIVEIGYHNPRTYPYVMAIVSVLLYCRPPLEKEKTADQILNKFRNISHTGHFQIWFQRVFGNKGYYLEEKLCRKVTNQQIGIWDCSWAPTELRYIANYFPIIDDQILKFIPNIIGLNEISAFSDGYK